jgi:hypothetical protein
MVIKLLFQEKIAVFLANRERIYRKINKNGGYQ